MSLFIYPQSSGETQKKIRIYLQAEEINEKDSHCSIFIVPCYVNSSLKILYLVSLSDFKEPLL